MKMTRLLPVLTALGVCAVPAAQKPLFEELKDFRAPVESPKEHVPGFLWLEAEGFADYGDWRLDTQFTHKMGSAYLIAPGVGRPLAGDARTTLAIPRAGTWRAWVRTKDWLPEFSPGVFTLCVNGAAGKRLGAAKREGWGWELAGEWKLPAGSVEVALKDLSGAFARCDAILFTTDAAYTPVEDEDVVPHGMEGVPTCTDAVRGAQSARGAARRKFRGEAEAIVDGGSYDVVVVGAGTAGMGAALAAARTGARVALVHDRPVLGGNSSCELGIGTDGAAIGSLRGRQNLRESGLCEEANLIRGRTPTKTLSAAYRLLAAAEKTFVECPNQRVQSVEKAGDAITAVLARSTLTGARTRYQAKIFIDCTGDGWVGVFADAARMYGREAQHEFNEWPAPEVRDDLTMSGCLMDRSLCYSHARRSQPVPYHAPAWAKVLPPDFDRPWIRHIGPEWWNEHGGRFDDCRDPERARDELIRIAFAYWDWIKNASPLKDQAANHEITFVPYMNGRREGYRLRGDYVLTAIDCLEGRMFPDRISYGGWPLDTHDPLGMENAKGNGYWCKHPSVPVYSIPYRCLYSANISNLMFAGRCVSVTHIALGSVRVEATLFTLGQAAGTAAGFASRAGLTPRAYGERHIADLQQRLLRDDQFIPELVNEDALDLARGAKVTATSGWDGTTKVFGKGDPALRTRDNTAHELTTGRATSFARGAMETLEGIDCLLVSTREKPVELTARLYATDDPKAKPDACEFLAAVKGVVPAKKSGFVSFRPAQPLALSKAFVWIELPAAKGVSWFLRERAVGPRDARAYGGKGHWTLVSGAQYAFVTTPCLRAIVDTRPEYVVDGVSRPVGTCWHGWASDPEEPLPQALTLTFPKPVKAREVRLTFDSDLTPTRAALHPKQLVKDYVVEGLVGGEWKTLVEVERNDLRLRVHPISETDLAALRVTVKATWGDPSARIFEIRVY
ncbi:MAG: FAD-dependent oxidoreductase [Kiritimatiellia bacterium]